MNSPFRLLRNVGLYLLFVLIYWAVGLITFLIVFFINRTIDDTRTAIAAPFATIVGGILGMKMAVDVLDRYFRPYPARLFAGWFIGISLIILVVGYGANLYWGVAPTFKNLTSTLGLLAGCAACWFLLWRGRSGRAATPPQPRS